MTQEDKQLALQDLCARLPYGVIGAVPHYDENGKEALLQGKITGFNEGQIKFEYLPDCTDDIGAYNWFDVDLVKLYLRPMSSMTEEEKKEYQSLCEIHSDHDADDNVTYYYFDTIESFDWLNAHHFDYRGLIEKGLAIEVTENDNPYKDLNNETIYRY